MSKNTTMEEKLLEIFEDVDVAFEKAGDDRAELNLELMKVWVKHGLISGHMSCSVGTGLGGD